MPTQSLERQIAATLVTQIQAQLDALSHSATATFYWHPSFAKKTDLDATLVTVRPARRSRRIDAGYSLGTREVTIEVGVVRHLAQPATSTEDPLNPSLLDELDLIAGDLFGMFCLGDPDEGTDGALARTEICGYHPGPNVEQPAILDHDLLESDRIFLALIAVPYLKID